MVISHPIKLNLFKGIQMNNYGYFVVLFALFGIVCYQVPQAIDKSIDNSDNAILIHKLSISE